MYTVVTVLLGVATLTVLALCFRNFDRGLKPHLLAPRLAFEQAMHYEEQTTGRRANDTSDERLIIDVVLAADATEAKSSAPPQLDIENTDGGAIRSRPSLNEIPSVRSNADAIEPVYSA